MPNKSGFRPRNKEQFDHAIEVGHHMLTHCMDCGQAFSSENTHSEAGWKETQISGICEDCFDTLFADPDDDFTPIDER